MRAIIPAAGIGKRLRPHTHSIPKALLYVAGKPILAHILDDVLKLGVESVALIVGYKGELIEEFVKNRYPEAKVDFIFQENRLGIGHAFSLTEKVIDKSKPIIAVLGDTIIKADLEEVVGADCNVLGVKEVEDPRRFGVCELSDGKITRLIEKPEDPPSNLALVGLYYIKDTGLLFDCLKEEIEKGIMTRGEYQITDALQMMIEKGAEFVPHVIKEWFDCGKPEALLETNRHLLDESGHAPEVEGSVIIPPVFIDSNASVISSIIGPHVSIGSSSIVKNSIIRDSVLGEGVKVTNSVLEKSILGSKVIVENRFKMLNIGDSSEVIIQQ